MFMLCPLIFSSMPSSSSSEPTPAKALTSLPLSFLPSTAASCFFCLSEAAPSLALSALVTLPSFLSAFIRFCCASYAALYSST